MLSDSLVAVLARDMALSDLLVLRDVFLSVRDSGVVIGFPYETRIDRLAPGEEATVAFKLLRNVEVVDICAKYGGVVDNRRVIPRDESRSTALTMHATPIFQEAMFGSKAYYDLTFYRGTSSKNAFTLGTIGLPGDFSWLFLDVMTGAQISKLDFSAQITSQRVTLEIQLPQKSTAEVPPDSSIAFRVVAKSGETAEPDAEHGLELKPRGIGHFVLYASNWLVRSEGNEPIKLSIEVNNDGSSMLREIQWNVETPPGWKVVSIEPDEPEISAGAATDEVITVLAPSGVEHGDYEVLVSVNGRSGSHLVESEKKVFRIYIESGSRVMQYVMLFVAVILVIGISVVMTLRFRNR